MASVLLVFKLEFGHTKNSYMPDTPQESWEGKIHVVALVGLGNLVALKVRVVVEGCEVLKQLLHQLELFEVGLALDVVVRDPLYKRKRICNIQ